MFYSSVAFVNMIGKSIINTINEMRNIKGKTREQKSPAPLPNVIR